MLSVASLSNLNVPAIRGEATIRILGPDGQVKTEQTGKNLLNRRFWDGLLLGENNTSIQYSSTALFSPRTYIGFQTTVPHPYESSAGMLGEGTDHPQGVFATGVEPITEYPYIQIRNLYQVTGSSRTIYSIGLTNNTGAPENDISQYRSCSTRLLLPEPVVQGVNDQIDLIYRLYFEEDPNSGTHPAYWADLVYWALTRTSDTTNWSDSQLFYGFALGMAGVGYQQANRQSTCIPPFVSHGNGWTGGWIRLIENDDFGVDNDYVRSRDSTASFYYFDQKFRTNKDYMVGELFNQWWPRDGGFDLRNVAWLGSQSGIQGNSVYQHSSYRLTKFIKNETTTTGPFHNSFNFNSTTPRLVYDIDNLPQTTWRAIFGGTWPSDDRYPLYGRLWWSESGAVDGSSAKYKLTFMRSLGNVRGLARDEVVNARGERLYGAANNTISEAENSYPGQTFWTLETDLQNGHHEYPNSRFGNLGFYRASGITNRYTGATTVFHNPANDFGRVFNVRKVVGLTTNTWWGWQSGKYGKSNHLGVEWRKLYPFERKVWQKADISASLNQIDWLEAVNGLPGEVDDEMCVIVDKTSGVYLINATTETVTQLTTLTGLDQCTVTRNPDTGELIYTGIKFAANDIDFYASDNNWQLTPFFNYERQVGGSEGIEPSDTNNQFSRSPGGAEIYFTSGYNFPSGQNSANVKGNDLKLQRAAFTFDGSWDCLRAYGNNQGTILNEYFDIDGSDDFTIEAWVKPTLFDTNRRPVVQFSDSCLLNAGTTFGFTIGGSDLPAFFTSTSSVKWYHLAVVRQNGVITTYKDGAVHAVLEDEFGTPVVDTTFIDSGQYIALGADDGGTYYDSDGLVGYMQQARITKAARYSGSFTPNDFTSEDASDDPYHSSTILNWTTEKQPLIISEAGTNLQNGTYDNLSTTTSGDGNGLTISAYVQSNVLTRISILDRGTGYRIGDTLSVTIPTLANPTFGAVLGLDASSLVPGSGYDDGIYTVTMSGGSGDQNVQTQITVVAGEVSSVVLSQSNQGTNYVAGDQIYANDSDLGGLGTGAGFSINIATVDEQTNLNSDPIEITVNSVATKLEGWWSTYSGRTVLIRRHWRHPDVFVGIFQSGDSNYAYFLDVNAGNLTFNYSAGMKNEGWGYVGEFFGDQGENNSGITGYNLAGTGSYVYQREIAWSDWIQFEPNGMLARTIGLTEHTYSDNWFKKSCTFVNTQRTYTSANRYTYSSVDGCEPWTAPHSLLAIPNAEDSNHPHYIKARRVSYSSSHHSQARVTGETPWIIKGGDRTVDDCAFEERGNIVSRLGCGSPNENISAGYYTNSWATPGAILASMIDSTGTGVYKENGVERYKGLALDGMNVNFCAPMWCARDPESLTSTSEYFPGAWPIDPQNDEFILHPLRWDTYGWDSTNSVWVREEWAYNFTEHRWEVDPATVKPGRPAPNGGGTHSLSGIPESPYNGLTVTFTDVRPEDTNDPIQGEWSGQYIYNGCVMDGVTEFTFAAGVSNRPITLKAISQTIPASGIINIPELYDDTFMWLWWREHYFDLEIDGVKANYEMTYYYNNEPAEGSIAPKYHQLFFNQNDVGKTLTGTYPVVNFAASEAPANWVWWTAEHAEAVDGTSTGLHGGNAYKDSSTLVSEGWTLHSTGGNNRYVNASDYASEFPNGFAYLRPHDPYTTEKYYAETIVINKQNIGFYWHDGVSSLTYNRNFNNDTSTTNNPVYGGACWAYDQQHYLIDIHTILHTDSSGGNWLIIRPQWGISGWDPVLIVVGEVWVSVDDPYTYEMRFGRWDSDLFATEYAPNGHNVGINWTGKWAGGTSTAMTAEYPNRWPYGAHGRQSYTSNIWYYNPWGGDISVNYPNHRYLINLDPHDYEEPA